MAQTNTACFIRSARFHCFYSLRVILYTILCRGSRKMHFISAISAYALHSKHKGVFELSQSISWWSWVCCFVSKSVINSLNSASVNDKLNWLYSLYYNPSGQEIGKQLKISVLVFSWVLFLFFSFFLNFFILLSMILCSVVFLFLQAFISVQSLPVILVITCMSAVALML